MKECDTPKTPLSQEEIEMRMNCFPSALHNLAVIEQLVRTTGPYTLEEPCVRSEKPKTFIIDGQVVRGMSGGIQKMYVDLVQIGEKKFADNVLQKCKK